MHRTAQSSQYLSEIRDSVCSAFQQCALAGVLAGEPLRGVRFNVEDAKVHPDAPHHGTGQIVPCTRAALYACQVTRAVKLAALSQTMLAIAAGLGALPSRAHLRVQRDCVHGGAW